MIRRASALMIGRLVSQTRKRAEGGGGEEEEENEEGEERARVKVAINALLARGK